MMLLKAVGGENEKRVDMDQYYLQDLNKIAIIVDAAGVLKSDVVLEVGAGVGSVAKHYPPCSLTLVDLDSNMVKILSHEFAERPEVEVVEQDGLEILRERAFDVLISHLPFYLTEGILAILVEKVETSPIIPVFKRAIVCVHNEDVLKDFACLSISTLCVLDKEDFLPHQPYLSKAILIEPRV